MKHSTYSFQEVIVTFLNNSGATLTTKGQGTGSISIGYSSDRTAKDVAADGHVVISKLSDRSGTLELNVQHSSPIHKQLLKWYNLVEGDDVSSEVWAGMTAIITSKSTGESKTCSGVAFNKVPDSTYEAQAGTVTWGFVCADISTQSI